jgi:hypothetical protein
MVCAVTAVATATMQTTAPVNRARVLSAKASTRALRMAAVVVAVAHEVVRVFCGGEWVAAQWTLALRSRSWLCG